MPLDDTTVGLTIVVAAIGGWVAGTVTDEALGLAVVGRAVVVAAVVVFTVVGLVVVGLMVVAAEVVLVDGFVEVDVALRDVEVVARLVNGAVVMDSENFGIAVVVVSDDRWTAVARSVDVSCVIEGSGIL